MVLVTVSDAGSPLSPCFPGPPLGDLRHSSDSNGCSGSSVASDQPVRKRHRSVTNNSNGNCVGGATSVSL
jgi:hypothetical protein